MMVRAGNFSSVACSNGVQLMILFRDELIG